MGLLDAGNLLDLHRPVWFDNWLRVALLEKIIECLLIHAVDISASVHSDHKVVVVGTLRVACYWEL